MCDCISKVNELLREQTEDPKAELVVTLGIGLHSLNAYPAMTAEYRAKKKNGELSDTKKKVSIRPAFCPFCGIEYEPTKEEVHP
jgi:hypothetical protein